MRHYVSNKNHGYGCQQLSKIENAETNDYLKNSDT